MNSSSQPPSGAPPAPGGSDEAGGGKPQGKRFGFELRQKSIDALAAEFRKLALLGTVATPFVGIIGQDAPRWLTWVTTAMVWIVIQLMAIAIERIRVYPRVEGNKGDNP